MIALVDCLFVYFCLSLFNLNSFTLYYFHFMLPLHIQHIVKHGLDWICKTRTGFVKHGFVKHGFVKGGLSFFVKMIALFDCLFVYFCPFLILILLLYYYWVAVWQYGNPSWKMGRISPFYFFPCR